MTNHHRQVTLIDRLYQVAYICAYRLMRVYWMVARPRTYGALVAIWQGNTILLVRNSYVPYYNLPGGYLRRGESASQAACRELKEEIGLSVPEEMLALAVDVTHNWEHKRDRVRIFQLELTKPLDVHVDHREVVAAGFFKPEEALRLKLFPPLRTYIQERQLAKAG